MIQPAQASPCRSDRCSNAFVPSTAASSRLGGPASPPRRARRLNARRRVGRLNLAFCFVSQHRQYPPTILCPTVPRPPETMQSRGESGDPPRADSARLLADTARRAPKKSALARVGQAAGAPLRSAADALRSAAASLNQNATGARRGKLFACAMVPTPRSRCCLDALRGDGIAMISDTASELQQRQASPAQDLPRSQIALIFFALLATVTLPLLIFKIPVMADYPNHLARIYAIASLSHDPLLARYYEIDWRLVPGPCRRCDHAALGAGGRHFHRGQAVRGADHRPAGDGPGRAVPRALSTHRPVAFHRVPLCLQHRLLLRSAQLSLRDGGGPVGEGGMDPAARASAARARIHLIAMHSRAVFLSFPRHRHLRHGDRLLRIAALVRYAGKAADAAARRGRAAPAVPARPAPDLGKPDRRVRAGHAVATLAG